MYRKRVASALAKERAEQEALRSQKRILRPQLQKRICTYSYTSGFVTTPSSSESNNFLGAEGRRLRETFPKAAGDGAEAPLRSESLQGRQA